MRAMLAIASICCAGIAHAATYQVGPTRPRTTLNQLFAAVNLQPGDIVEVDFATYAGGIVMSGIDDGGDDEGAPGNPVVIRGIRDGLGQRPRLVGGTNTIEFRLADHVVFEGFDVSGTGDTLTGTFRCIYHHSNDVVIRDVYVHDCPRHGILGSDQDSGSLTVEYSEIYNAGATLWQGGPDLPVAVHGVAGGAIGHRVVVVSGATRAGFTTGATGRVFELTLPP